MDIGEQPTKKTGSARKVSTRFWAAVGATLFVLLAGSLAASAELEHRLVSPAGSAFAQVQSDGELAFDRQCVGCHGVDGQGGIAPDLRLWDGSLEETTTVIAQGVSGMPAFSATLTAEQIESLASYLDELVGASVYVRECAGCHGAAGEGGTGPSLKVSTLGEAERREVIAGGAGSMPGFGSDLTEEEIEALVWRMQGYSSVGSTLYATQCAPCHGALGEGFTGPPLVDLSTNPTEAEVIVTSGFGGMPAFGTSLEPGDIEAIVRFALSLESSTTTTAAATTTTTEPVSGIDLYAGFCASCHGVDAEGGIAPSVVGLDISDEELHDLIASGQGSMPGFAELLDDAQADALVGFILDLATPSGVEATEAGADLYAQQCAACHGADGRGGLGPSLRTILLTGRELRAAIREGNATMPAFGHTLDDAAIDLAAEFVEWLKQADVVGVPLRGGSVIYRQDCSACHGERGEGGIGPELSDTDLSVNEIVAQVYGGHAEGMPAFAGALDGRQVRDVAHFIKTFVSGDVEDGGIGFGWWMLIGAGVVAFAAVGWLVMGRVRRRTETS